MVVKSLIQHGNSKAIIIDKKLLRLAGIEDEDNALFQITADPNSGITIQSVKPVKNSHFKDSQEKIIKKHSKLFKTLADR